MFEVVDELELARDLGYAEYGVGAKDVSVLPRNWVDYDGSSLIVREVDLDSSGRTKPIHFDGLSVAKLKHEKREIPSGWKLHFHTADSEEPRLVLHKVG